MGGNWASRGVMRPRRPKEAGNAPAPEDWTVSYRRIGNYLSLTAGSALLLTGIILAITPLIGGWQLRTPGGPLEPLTTAGLVHVAGLFCLVSGGGIFLWGFFGHTELKKKVSKMNEYRVTFLAGLAILPIGAGLLGLSFVTGGWTVGKSKTTPLGEALAVASLVILLVGGLSAGAGWNGYRYEMKKAGTVRVHTKTGWKALGAGMASLGLAVVPGVGLVIGIVALRWGRDAIREGDTEYGREGRVLGAIGVVLGILRIVTLLPAA